MNLELRFWCVSAVCFVLFGVLGWYVVHSAQLPRIDMYGANLRGAATSFAAALTFTGRGPFLFALMAVLAAAAYRGVFSLRVIAVLAVSQVLSQTVIELLKHVFARHRPDYWLIGLERGFSYPSGHAATAVTFFWTTAALIVLSPLAKPLKVALACAALAWAFGIDWSRLALGAHYPTDVIGGTLFGVAWISAVAALCLHFHVISTA